ncbi:MAG: MotA/TolQ/ExbB proton channel family protein [Candidatus Krumholzibacteriia bacterium]
MVESLAVFFRTGGPLMWAILSVLAVALAVIAERLHFFLVVCREPADALATQTVRHLDRDDARAALSALASGTSPIARILRPVVESQEAGAAAADARLAAEEAAIREAPRYGRRIAYLSMLANIATLTGLLGTIFGLQQSFSSLAVADAADKASLLAAGISQAMNTTAFGLIVAIPCLIAYARLASLAARRTEECDAAAVKVLGYLEVRARSPRELSLAVAERAAV